MAKDYSRLHYLSKKLFLLVLIFLKQIPTFSQAVINDSIDHKIHLSINNGFFASSTSECTVEWNCVEKEKLKSTITFHNDQWFSFRPRKQGHYYLVVRNQLCKEKRGVQVLVIDGIPCVPTSYSYLKLHSLLSTEDINYKLSDLKDNHEYLISIDGLLGDQCQFEIGISDTIPGNVINSVSKEIDVKAERGKNTIILKWKANRLMKDSIYKFLIYRKIGSTPFQVIDSFPTGSYSHGNHEEEFIKEDVMTQPDDYFYYIVGETRLGIKYSYKSFNVKNNSINPDSRFIYTFRSSYKGKGEIRFRIINADNQQLLSSREKENKHNELFGINLLSYYATGIKRFRIIIDYKKDPATTKEELFVIN
jgi:hypothetical protein